ncbi:hypothetical protein [Pseudomonas sp. DSP3-2-2]|uniref:hypothetical protein n=1 Tax=unclassified Pseudomonas TaxID=196821 RepID=UPI003CFB6557
MSDSNNSDEVIIDAADSMSKVLTREALEGAEVASWKIKAHPHPIAIIDKTFIALMLIPFAFYGFSADSTDQNDGGFIQDMSLCGAGWIIFFWFIARKKTVFNYTFTEDGGHVEYWQHYARIMPYFFKGVAITAFVAILTMIAIQPSAI